MERRASYMHPHLARGIGYHHFCSSHGVVPVSLLHVVAADGQLASVPDRQDFRGVFGGDDFGPAPPPVGMWRRELGGGYSRHMRKEPADTVKPLFHRIVCRCHERHLCVSGERSGWR